MTSSIAPYVKSARDEAASRQYHRRAKSQAAMTRGARTWRETRIDIVADTAPRGLLRYPRVMRGTMRLPELTSTHISEFGLKGTAKPVTMYSSAPPSTHMNIVELLGVYEIRMVVQADEVVPDLQSTLVHPALRFVHSYSSDVSTDVDHRSNLKSLR